VKYASEMASGGIIHILSFVNIGSGIRTLLGEFQQGDLMSPLLFFSK
jgi:hypothetical protein